MMRRIGAIRSHRAGTSVPAGGVVLVSLKPTGTAGIRAPLLNNSWRLDIFAVSEDEVEDEN